MQPLDQREHRLVRLKDFLPRRDESLLGSAVAQHVEDTAQETRPVDLPVLVGDLHTVDARENLHGVVHLALRRELFQSQREIETQQHIANVEKES